MLGKVGAQRSEIAVFPSLERGLNTDHVHILLSNFTHQTDVESLPKFVDYPCLHKCDILIAGKLLCRHFPHIKTFPRERREALKT